jgi:hypothetical protein
MPDLLDLLNDLLNELTEHGNNPEAHGNDSI